MKPASSIRNITLKHIDERLFFSLTISTYLSITEFPSQKLVNKTNQSFPEPAHHATELCPFHIELHFFDSTC